MKKMLAVALACATFVPVAFAASNPWDGTWKVDHARSHVTGTSFTYSKAADGKWLFISGPIKIEFGTDGKPYPVFDQEHSVVATMPNPHTLKMSNLFKGKEVSTSVATLSPDGKSVSVVTSGTHEDGSHYSSTETDTHSGAGEGFFGTWTSTKSSDSSPDVSVIHTSGDTVSFYSPEEKSTLNVKLDGTPATPTGPQATKGLTVAYKSAGPHRLDYIVALQGKKIVEGYDELSADGKTYTDVSWLVGKASEKTSIVYMKQ